MPRSSKSFLFPDVNVWLALTYEGHVHHAVARAWFQQLDQEARLCFCRITQLSLLRLVTTEAVMGKDEVLTQTQAWAAYDRWFDDARVLFLEEPANVETVFRSLSRQSRSTSKGWADSYLLAFASAANLRLVTFDQALSQKDTNVLFLR